MHVCIYGEYTRRSLGDHLILYGLLRAILRSAPEAQVTVVCGDNDAVRATLTFAAERIGVPVGRFRVCPLPVGRILNRLTLFTARLRKSRLFRRTTFPDRVLRYGNVRRLVRRQKPDVLLLGGGQMLMDLYPVGLIEPLEIVRIFRGAGVPARAFGIGAGPLGSAAGRADAREIAAGLAPLTVRDSESRTLLEETCDLSGIENVGDAAFLALDRQGATPAALPRDAGQPVVGLSVVPYEMAPYWPGGCDTVFARYVSAWAALVDAIHAAFPGTRFVGVTTNIPHDGCAFERVRNAASCPDRLTLTPQAGLADLFECVGGIDVMIASRMHASVLALVRGRPTLGVAYQPKVAALYGELGLAGDCTPVAADGGFDAAACAARFGALMADAGERRRAAERARVHAAAGEAAFERFWRT